jgi:hypothetical protein
MSREYEMKKIGASPSRSEQEDPTFSLSTPPLFASSAKKYKALDKFFGTDGYARLQDADSDDALKVVRTRISDLCAKLW